ncbi:MAG: translocation/assembly module TamB domain-containing protein [Henriciella sp.]
MLIAVRWLAATEIGHSIAERRIGAMSPLGQSIQIEGLSGDLLGKFTADKITLSDEMGVWVKAENVTLRWGPLSLLYRKLSIEDLIIDDLEIARQPVLIRDPSSTGGSPLRRYRVNNLDVAQFHVAETLTRRAVDARLQAKLDTNISSGASTLLFVPAEDLGDRIQADISWGGDVPVIAEIDATGPADGFLATLLGANTTGEIAITLRADGAPEDWTMAGALTLGGDVKAALSGALSDSQLMSEASIDLSAFSPLQPLAKRLGANLILRGKAGSDDFADLHVTSETVSLLARLPVNIKRRTADLRSIEIKAEALSPDPLSFSQGGASTARANGLLGFEGETIRWDGEIDVAGLSLSNYAADTVSGPVSVEWNRDIGTATSDFRLEATGFYSDDKTVQAALGPAVEAGASLEVNLQDRRVTVVSSEIKTAEGQISADGAFDLSLSRLDLKGRFAHAAKSNLLPSDLGLTQTRWAVSRENAGPYVFTLDARAAFHGPPPLPWLGGPLQLALNGQYQGGSQVAFESASLSGDLIDLDGAGLISPEVISLDLSGTLGAGEIGSAGVQSVGLTASVTGSMAAPSIDLLVQPKGLNVSGQKVDTPRLRIAGTRAKQEFDGTVEARAFLADAPLSLDGKLKQAGADWQLFDISSDLTGLTLTGEASGTGGDLSKLNANFLLDGSPSGLDWIGGVSGRIGFTNEAVDTDLIFREISFEPFEISQARLKASGTRTKTIGSLTLQGNVLRGLRKAPLRFETAFRAAPLEGRLEADLDGMYDGQSFQTLQPINLTHTGADTVFSGKLSALGGDIAISGTRTGLAITGDVIGQNLDAGAAMRLLNRPGLRGTASLRANINGSGSELAGRAELSVDDFAQSRPNSPASDLTLVLILADRMIKIAAAAVDQEGGLSVTAEGRLPALAAARPFKLGLDQTAPVTLSLNGNGNIENLWSFLGVPDTRFEGQFSADLNAFGSLSELRTDGTVRLDQAVFEDGVQGLYLKDISMTALLSPQSVIVESLSATGINGGEIVGSGQYGFNGKSDVDIRLDKLDAFQRRDASAIVSGDLSIRRLDRRTRISGNLDFDRALIDVDRLPRGGYTTLDVRFPGRGEAAPTESRTPPIALDIGLSADRRIFISGTGMTSEWSLDAKLGGTIPEPTIIGEAVIVRGDVDVVGRQFRFRDSSIRFQGDPSAAQLNIKAERQTGDFSASLNVGGTVLEPSFDLSSEPSLPDDEVLSRVLFGVSPSQLGPFQAAQLAAAIASLSGGQTFDLVGPIEDVLDVDRVDFGVSEDGVASVGAGKYLADDVYVEVRTNTRGAPGLGVEWTPRENVEIGAELGTEEAPEFTVKWKRDYDFDKPSPADTNQGQVSE